jgi:hypothetical protein
MGELDHAADGERGGNRHAGERSGRASTFVMLLRPGYHSLAVHCPLAICIEPALGIQNDILDRDRLAGQADRRIIGLCSVEVCHFP